MQGIGVQEATLAYLFSTKLGLEREMGGSERKILCVCRMPSLTANASLRFSSILTSDICTRRHYHFFALDENLMQFKMLRSRKRRTSNIPSCSNCSDFFSTLLVTWVCSDQSGFSTPLSTLVLSQVSPEVGFLPCGY